MSQPINLDRRFFCIFRAAPALALLLCGLFLLPRQAHAFGFDDVIAKAKALAAEPYQPVREIPAWMQFPALTYDQYQQIRFRPELRLWRAEGSNFGVMLQPAGLYYTRAVGIHIVNDGTVHPLAFDKSLFTYPDKTFARRVPVNLGYGGLAITYPLEPGAPYNSFLVFGGASYFRAVGRDEGFGLSARGLAIDTGLSSPESFPLFRSFWLVKPAPGAGTMDLYALLDGEHVSGAYRFVVQPGAATTLDVTAVLYFRDHPERVGLAPLTSMFFYGANTSRPAGEWRAAVHDSSGLGVENGDGEWLWRPLINPQSIATTSFTVADPKGFGLLQRPRRFADYEDLEARYDLRPNAWVTPIGAWGKGQIMLVELPESDETEDNIVAFYTPDSLPPPGQPLILHYRLTFGGEGVGTPPAGYAAATFVGAGTNPGTQASGCALRFIVNFRGGELGQLAEGVEAQVSTVAGGKIEEVHVEQAPPFSGWRLSFLVSPAQGQPLDLRAYLTRGKETLTETWTYMLPPDMLSSYQPGCSVAQDPGR
ncbi:MAG: glucan biosynthesis protein [Gammaproteobacteria bacterium]